jgi:ferritin-like metal-binding protein YciE
MNMQNETTTGRVYARVQVGKSLLEEFFVHQLRDLCAAEQHMIIMLNTWKEMASSPELTNAIEEHLTHTEQHIDRLYIVMDLLEETVTDMKSESMEGIEQETERVLAEIREGSATRDVAIIIAVQKMEHYEIAAYGSLITLARTMGRDDVAEILKHNMSDEKQMDELLSGLAENGINREANTESAPRLTT